MTYLPLTSDRTLKLLEKWREGIQLSNFESNQLSGLLLNLDIQLKRFKDKSLRVSVFGRVGVGKSSLVNALIKKKVFPTDVKHGSTRSTKSIKWDKKIGSINNIYLVDTPGIDEINSKARSRLAKRVALQSDMVLLVIDNDINQIELKALEDILKSCKPVILVLNRSDQWNKEEIKEILISIKKRLDYSQGNLFIEVVSSSPRKPYLNKSGVVRSKKSLPKVENLDRRLESIIKNYGELLLTINSIRQADNLDKALKVLRLRRSKSAAQALIGKFAAIKASGVAINSLAFLDLACGLACDTALIIQLSSLYGMDMKGSEARKLLKHLSIQNCFLGGTQYGIQLLLGLVKQISILLSPLTGGITLISTGPVALAQAGLAVYTTKLTARLAAKIFLNGGKRHNLQPDLILKKLSLNDPEIKSLINFWPSNILTDSQKLRGKFP
tara:strand:- start:402 stop:1724 length:1323 start_codon:yes stop_codon:yes gene_type:complete